MISPENQLNSITAHCAQAGYDIVETLEDLDLTGRFWKRRQVEQAIKMIEDKKAEVLVVWKISRVSRNRMDWAIAVDRVESIGGRLESSTEPMDTSTSSGRFARGVLAEMAVFESERIGDTWKEAHARRYRNGLPHNSPKHFGYTYSKEDGYTPDAAEAAVLRQMYIRFTAGSTFHEIAAYAVAEGFDKEAGWRVGGIRRMLDRGFGAGFLYLRKKDELIRGAHEPVISELEWKAYQVRRGERGGRPRAESTEYPYSGIVRCFCGSSMGGSSITRNGHKFRRYVCLNGTQKVGHKQVSVSEPYVEDAILEWLESVASEIDTEAAKIKPPKAECQGRIASQLAASIEKNQRRLDSLTMKRLDEEISQEVYLRLKDSLEAEKKSLEARQRLVEVNATVRPAVIVPQLLKQWDSLPARGKREILGRLVAKIQLHDWESESRTGRRKITVVEHDWE